MFRGELLGMRRRMLDMTQAELAARAQMSQATLSKIEQTLREPTAEQLERLSTALSCVPSFFSQTEREYGPPMSAHPMFRKKAAVGQRVLDKVIAEMNVRIGHLRTFLRSVDFSPELPLPQYPADEFGDDIESVAQNVRRAWYVPNGPIRSLTEFMERAGCVIIPCDMEAARIDGASYRIPGLPPIVFLNKNQPSDRMRFSLAHELAHLILHKYPEPHMERQADEFASAFLMPRADIGPHLSDLSITKAAYLKPVWRVSIAAILVRATTIGVVSKDKATYLWKQMSSKGYRLREPASLDFPPEMPTLLNGLTAYFTQQLGYGPADFERLLHLGAEEVSTMYGLKFGPSIRRVK